MRTAISVAIAACLVAGCETQERSADTKPDAREGKEVSQVCFVNQINSWQPLGDRDVTIELGVKEMYKLSLAGTCRPQDAFTSIGLISRGGGSCLSRGDDLVTDRRYLGGRCYITRINEWDRKPASSVSP